VRVLGPVWRKVALAAGAVVAAAVLGAGCGGSGGQPKDVVLVTHDSFAVSKDVERAFEHDTGLRLRILQGGDANDTLNTALLTSGDHHVVVYLSIDVCLL
jgi:thiamine transport system substrate-binding protein